MVQTAALRRTVRRCTAVIVLTLGLVTIALTDGSAVIPLLLVALAALYLVGSFVNHTPTDVKQGDSTD
jgi:hypothetical protein